MQHTKQGFAVYLHTVHACQQVMDQRSNLICGLCWLNLQKTGTQSAGGGEEGEVSLPNIFQSKVERSKAASNRKLDSNGKQCWPLRIGRDPDKVSKSNEVGQKSEDRTSSTDRKHFVQAYHAFMFMRYLVAPKAHWGKTFAARTWDIS